MDPILFQTINWSEIEKVQYPGTTGNAWWQTIQFPNLRVRIVEYSNNYLADHWCRKGHIVHCLEGAIISEMENGTKYTLSKGMTYIVTDNASSHRSVSGTGAKLLIIDGDFLKETEATSPI